MRSSVDALQLPTVSVILATYRRPEAVARVLQDLARQVEVNAEIIVLDQNQPLLPVEMFAEIRESRHKLRVVPQPPGVVAARNAGAHIATGDVLVLIDDDVRIEDAQFLAHHARNYLDETVAGVCGQELLPPNFSTREKASVFSQAFEEAVFFQRESTERREVFHLATCNCSIRRSAWDRIGGLDEGYRGNSYGDDYDLALRMRAAGLKVVFDPSASVRHLQLPLGGLRLGDPRNAWSEADKYVSLFRFYFRHVPARWRRWYWHKCVLRKSLLLRRNLVRPWRWPVIGWGLASAYFKARRALARV
jgi:GT2 family glycosyltransferase